MLYGGNKAVAGETKESAKSTQEKTVTPDEPRRYFTIWLHGVWRRHSSLIPIVNAPLISHVMGVGLSADDHPNYMQDKRYRAMRRLCHQGQKKFIWGRWLYPGYKVERFNPEVVYDYRFYVRHIRSIRREQELMKADMVALDTEAYAYSPLKEWVNKPLSPEDYARLEGAIEKAVQEAGQVDIVFPGPKAGERYAYNALARLGKRIMGEHTYYDRKIPPREERYYDLFGAAVAHNKENPDYPRLPLFTPKEILSRRELWEACDGLCFYPWYNDERRDVVAQMMAEVKPEEVGWRGPLPGTSDPSREASP